MAAGLAIATGGGCAAGISPSDTLAQALDKLTQKASAFPALNRLTVGDVVAGFTQFVSQLTGGNATGASAQASSSQLDAQIGELQTQLDQGQITSSQFAAAVSTLYGQSAAGLQQQHVMIFGGPFNHAAPAAGMDPLNLTDAQRQQAQQLFEQAHADIRALRQAAHEKILAVLTPDQQAALSQVGSVNAGTIAAGSAPAGGQPTSWFQYLAEQLQLTSDQVTQIDQIRTDLRTAVQNRHQQARDDFRALLTPDQQQKLDELEAILGVASSAPAGS